MSPTDPLQTRLKKVKGQIDGITQMYEEGRACLDIVQQIVAARSALSSIARDVLTGEASRCARTRTPEDFDRILKTLVEMT
jgi:CsoR family transcriptional regulator, copper-sensing transcriptional repressor